jgi:uncharacterized repeat protein (TIGR02059 family)
LKIALTILFLLTGIVINAQTILTVQGETITSTYTVPHTSPTTFTFINNSITTSNASGYILNAGDEVQSSNNNNLDGAVITGNKVIWNGTTNNGTHGLFVGYNINDIIKYNYIDRSPYGIVVKSGDSDGSSMAFTSGGIAYNIIKDSPTIGVIVRGINNVPIYNNTFYNSTTGTSALIFIQENESAAGSPTSSGCKIYNNIFYTTTQSINIYISDLSCTEDFESDYNVFYCTAGTPFFGYGTNTLTFAQWQALGYDTHSVVVNPNFNNSTDLLPNSRLNYGTNLGTTWQTGLSTSATWTVNSAPATTVQNGSWQAGARIYGTSSSVTSYISSVIENATPSRLEMTYNVSLANPAPSPSAFSVLVNSVARTVNTVTISGTKVQLTLASPVINGDVVTVAYTKPSSNPIQDASGNQAATIGAQAVINNVNAAIINPVYVSSVIQNATPGVLEMTYNLNLANIVPSTASFSVMVNSVARSVNSIVISGAKVMLTLGSPVVNGNIVTVAYTKPTINPLQTASGGQAVTLSTQTVINNVNAAIINPVYVSSTIQNATPGVLEMTYNLNLANIVPSTASFSVMVNSVARSVNSIVISGAKVMLTLGSPVVNGNIVTVAYTKPTINPLQTASGGQAVTLSAQTVTNNVSAAILPPVYVSSVIQNDTPDILEITYSLNLANIVPLPSAYSVMVNSVLRSVNSVSISWSKIFLTLASNVVYGDVVTVAYVKPATNPVQTSLGGQAVSISAQTVINNCTLAANQSPVISITSPANGLSYISPATIAITVNTSDPDGTISKVEYFIGTQKIGEELSAPYSFSFESTVVGKYEITAVATDNLNAAASSLTVLVNVTLNEINPDFINLYPNPNDGHFSIDLFTLPEDKRSLVTISTMTGMKVYNELMQKEETIKHFDLSRLNPGVYILMISSNEILITKKFIVE